VATTDSSRSSLFTSGCCRAVVRLCASSLDAPRPCWWSTTRVGDLLWVPTETPRGPAESGHAQQNRVSASHGGGNGGIRTLVPLGTLAFKIIDPVISGNHPSGMGRSPARPRSLQGLTNRERMQPQMPPLHHASTHDRV
jgi:hypothetical protein